uniref:Uncharacterized protein n=1 Tax=Avena sativa TaxID=4498 RepID=A0ACD5TFJ4_AVESA
METRGWEKCSFLVGQIVCDCSLASLFWDLYSICNEPTATVAEVVVGDEIRLSFRLCFSSPMMCRWLELCRLLGPISLSCCMDKPVWSLAACGQYSAKTFYRRVNDGGVRMPHLAAIWKIQIPGQVQVFLWLLAQNRLLTRENLAKRRNMSDQTCLFCLEIETNHHLFFDCW